MSNTIQANDPRLATAPPAAALPQASAGGDVAGLNIRSSVIAQVTLSLQATADRHLVAFVPAGFERPQVREPQAGSRVAEQPSVQPNPLLRLPSRREPPLVPLSPAEEHLHDAALRESEELRAAPVGGFSERLSSDRRFGPAANEADVAAPREADAAGARTASKGFGRAVVWAIAVALGLVTLYGFERGYLTSQLSNSAQSELAGEAAVRLQAQRERERDARAARHHDGSPKAGATPAAR
jgi:hypothetical protein